MIVADAVSARIVQVSSGITRYWPGLENAYSLIGAPLADWVDVLDQARTGTNQVITELLPDYPATAPLRLRFERTAGDAAASASADWGCLGHLCGRQAILEWQPGAMAEGGHRHNGHLFGKLTQAITRLRRAEGLERFYDECVRVIQEFCGFDRVMIYRFLADGSGEVMAEHTANDHPERFRGLRFPASDIPAQARQLYLSNRLRILADVEAAADTLLPDRLPDGALLDQSHCVLRGLSPVHLSYLHNMQVRATLTLSIIYNDRLWGLTACHHHEPRVPPKHVTENLRQACELIAEVTNMRIAALSQLARVRQRIVFDRLLNQLHQALIQGDDVPFVLELHLPPLLTAFDASGFGFRIGALGYFKGIAEPVQPMRDILDEVALRADPQERGLAMLKRDDLLSRSGTRLRTLPEAAGLLLAQRHDDDLDFCFLVRQEVVRQVRWGGKPVKDAVRLPGGRTRLEPRRSFEEWQQSVQGMSAPWEQAELEALKMLLQILRDVHKLHVNRALQEKLHWRAHHDHLTGLLNRRAMEEKVSKQLDDGQFDVALLLLDLDHFKKINDTHGHAAGDQVLQQLSRRLGTVIRDFDLLARLGGDEFMLLLQIVHPDPARALRLAQRLHDAVLAPFIIDGQRLPLKISVGIAIPPEHGRTVSELLRHADLALYHAKALGRSRSIVFERAMESNQLDCYLIEHELISAIEQGQLALVYQPKVDLVRQRVVGLEALVRWNHPTRGLSLPGVFIPIAERSDQIVQIDRWVMQEAVAVQAKWQAQGLPVLPIAVNLSMSDILSSNLLSFLCELLSRYEISPDALEVEVTESCMMRELERTQAVLRSLNRHGISTTLDDFGTGFSSLSYLRQLPLQCLKIDQSFTQNMLQDTNTGKLTQAILAMGAALDMRIVAEGVETDEQMRWLLRHGCHVGQGNFFSPPVAQEDVHETIRCIEDRLAQVASA